MSNPQKPARRPNIITNGGCADITIVLWGSGGLSGLASLLASGLWQLELGLDLLGPTAVNRTTPPRHPILIGH
jgi:hypothetical protein